jgi:hypothetical protein
VWIFTYSAISVRGCTQKFPDLVGNEIYAYNIKNWLRSNTKGYGGKTHLKNTDATAPGGRELYHLQFLLQAASPETFGYTVLRVHDVVLRQKTLSLTLLVGLSSGYLRALFSVITLI